MKEHHSDLMDIVKVTYPEASFPTIPRDKCLILDYPTVVKILRENGLEMGDFDDLKLSHERKIGQIFKEKTGSDLLVVDKFPMAIRPFYAMPDPEKPGYSNTMDILLCGEEISSGGQRQHDYAELISAAISKGMNPDKLGSYLDLFKFGVYPHAGCGIGLERIMMLLLGLPTVKLTSLFPRTPDRLNP